MQQALPDGIGTVRVTLPPYTAHGVGALSDVGVAAILRTLPRQHQGAFGDFAVFQAQAGSDAHPMLGLDELSTPQQHALFSQRDVVELRFEAPCPSVRLGLVFPIVLPGEMPDENVWRIQVDGVEFVLDGFALGEDAPPLHVAETEELLLLGDALAGDDGLRALLDTLRPPPPPPTILEFLRGTTIDFRALGPMPFALLCLALFGGGVVVIVGVAKLLHETPMARWASTAGNWLYRHSGFAFDTTPTYLDISTDEVEKRAFQARVDAGDPRAQGEEQPQGLELPAPAGTSPSKQMPKE